jgi:hypothetical protein
MTLPNPERAVVDIAKLRDYCLSSTHPRGKHKARVFLSSLGLGAEDAHVLQGLLLAAALTHEVIVGEKDDFGQRYILDVELMTDVGTAKVRSAWIVRADEDFARLLTCYML